jgi:hypothetical protein
VALQECHTLASHYESLPDLLECHVSAQEVRGTPRGPCTCHILQWHSWSAIHLHLSKSALRNCYTHTPPDLDTPEVPYTCPTVPWHSWSTMGSPHLVMALLECHSHGHLDLVECYPLHICYTYASPQLWYSRSAMHRPQFARAV